MDILGELHTISDIICARREGEMALFDRLRLILERKKHPDIVVTIPGFEITKLPGDGDDTSAIAIEDRSPQTAGADDEPGEIVARAASVYVAIKYVDSKGATSNRAVTINKIEANEGDFNIWAYCHSRRAVRQFKMSRIVEVIDPESGEVHDNPIEYFTAAALLPAGSDFNPTLRVLMEISTELSVLIYLARADGKMAKSEADAIVRHIYEYGERVGVDIDENIVRKHLRRLRPDWGCCLEGAKKIAAPESTHRHQAIIDTAVAVAGADGVIDPAERELYRDLVTAFRDSGSNVIAPDL